MTDALIEEIYALGRDAIKAGQKTFQVHAFPFRMTESNLERHANSPWVPFWRTLKEGYDHFEATRLPPDVAVCERKYIVNVKLPQNKLDPERQCPQLERPVVAPFVPKPGEQVAEERSMAPGSKSREVAATFGVLGNGTILAGSAPTANGQTASGLTGLGFQQR